MTFQNIPPSKNHFSQNASLSSPDWSSPDQSSSGPIYTTHTPLNMVIGDSVESPFILSLEHTATQAHEQSKKRKVALAGLIFACCFLGYFVLMGCLYLIRRNYLTYDKKYQELDRELKKNSATDPLTGLANRKQFVQRLEQLIEICQHAPHENFALIMTDLDDFKVINESLGHSLGNDLLRQVSERIKRAAEKNLNTEYSISRLGGDEFGIIVENTNDVSTVVSLAREIHKTFEDKFILGSKEITETTSIGIVMLSNHLSERAIMTASDLIRDADIAMYRAKNRGRGQFEIFNKQMHVDAMRRIETENDIRRGIEEGEFFCRFHPIVDIQTNRVSSLEALARWNHPARQELAPCEFIPVAEEIDLIHQIDQVVLAQAIHHLSNWKDTLPHLDDLSINVNHSACNFNSREAMDNIFEHLSKTGISGKNLKIELTESSILDNEIVATNVFEELREKGIHLCMDDFGTGFSSLHYLSKWRFDMLKIDQSFVRDMLTSNDAKKIVRAMIEMSNHLGLAVTAEGVETREQLNMLREMGCRYAQGYFFCQPLKAEDVPAFITQHEQFAQINTSKLRAVD